MTIVDVALKGIEPLIGSTITAMAHGVSEDGEDYFGIVVQKKDGIKQALYFLRDAEGNGPGWFDVEPYQFLSKFLDGIINTPTPHEPVAHG